MVVRPGTRSIDALPGLKTGALRTNLVATVLGLGWTKVHSALKKRGPHGIVGALLFGDSQLFGGVTPPQWGLGVL